MTAGPSREGEQACLDLELLLTNQGFQEGSVCAGEKVVKQWLEDGCAHGSAL